MTANDCEYFATNESLFSILLASNDQKYYAQISTQNASLSCDYKLK